jgi:hypothetical protein
MKPEKKISLLFLCVAMLIIAGCRKDETPAEVKTPVGFRAMSQAVLTKAGETEPLSKYHDTFGVWGIANSSFNDLYVLWSNHDFVEVKRESQTDIYAPVSDAYWLKDYIYHFIALAPYNSDITDFSVTTTKPALEFNYSLKNKYDTTNDEYNPSFDLMGAVARTEVGATKPVSQNLIFWHILSQININVWFTQDPFGNQVSGKVDRLRLKNIDSDGTYTISFTDSDNDGEVDDLSVGCDATTGSNNQYTISFNGSNTPSTIDSPYSCSLNIFPQNIQNFELYIDFTIGNVEYKDYRINMKEPYDYVYNGKYNWKVIISPTAYVSFSVSVAEWDDNNNLGYPADDENIII